MASLLIDEPAPQVRRFTLNRPERMNALDGPTLQALHDAARGCAAAGDAVKVLVIRGSGRAFCAGNDLKWLAGGVLDDRAAHMRHQDLMQATFECLESAPQIVLESATLQLAQEIARADALALSSMKQMARRAQELPLQDGLRYERWMQHRYRTQSGALEAGVQAFAGKGAG